MSIQTIILSLSLFLFPLAALAGSGHDHGQSRTPVTQSQAEQVAGNSILRLVEQGKIDASWKSVQVDKALKKKFGNNMEWVISYKNGSISNPAKQTIYVFLTLSGEYLAANYTGE